MGAIREKVRALLDGFEDRQAEREACRRLAGTIRMVYHYRSSGVMGTLEESKNVLTRLGISWEADLYYGVTVLSTRVGVVLCFGPTGKYAWGTGPRIESSLTGDQLELFSEPPSETFSF